MKNIKWIQVGCLFFSILFAGTSAYFAFEFHFSSGLWGNPAFTVDQILATLTVTVGLLGLIVAVIAIVIGAAAIFGYAEIRQITRRKTEDVLRNVIAELVKRNEISHATGQVLLQQVYEVPVDTGSLDPGPISVNRLNSEESTRGTQASENSSMVEGAERYPSEREQGDGNNNDKSKHST